MPLFGVLNQILGTPTPPPKVVTPPVVPQIAVPPVGQSNGTQTSNSNNTGTQSGTTGTTAPAAQTTDTSTATPPSQGSSWPGQLPPPPDTGGVSFDFSPDALANSDQGKPTAPETPKVTATTVPVIETASDTTPAATTPPAATTTGPDEAATSGTAPDPAPTTAVDTAKPADPTINAETSGKVASAANNAQTSASVLAEPVTVTGNTMTRVQNDEDRIRAWSIGALQQERLAALPLSLVTNATATPRPQAVNLTADNSSPMATTKADLAATPARVLARA